MAVQNAKSQLVTDLDASPVVKHGALEVSGTVKETIATLTLTATQAGGDAGSVWRFVRVPARARISRVEIANDDLDSGAGALEGDVGLYEVDGGAAKDANFFTDAYADLDTAKAFVDVTHLATTAYDIKDASKALWEALGDTDTPENRNKEYDVAFTVGTAASTGAAGDITVKVTYVEL